MVPKGWRTLPLEAVVGLKRGFDLPTSKRVDGNVPVVGSAGISGWHNEVMVKGPGVVVGRAGASMGVATYVAEDFWPLNTSLFVEDFRGNDPRFVFSLLRCLDFSGYNSGAAQPMLNRNYIKAIRVALPDTEEQRAIAEVLGVLEDKIEINERIAEGAVELASAKASPDLWEGHALIRDLCNLHKRQVNPAALSASLVDHYSIPAHDARSGPEVVVPTSIKSSKFLVDKPCVLLSKLNPETPRVWPVLVAGERPGVASTEFLVLSPKQGISVAELWAVVNQGDLFAELAAKAGGTSRSHQRVRPQEVMVGEVSDPAAMGESTRQNINSLMLRVESARRENRTLAELRDTLLPKLVSGQIRIKDAESAVEEVV